VIAVVLIDAFEVMILPRRIRRSYRLARLVYLPLWQGWHRAARAFPSGRWRQAFLGIFGPLSLFALFGVWAIGLVAGFALLHWSIGTAIHGADGRYSTDLYFSGTTFFTLGYGDIVPTGPFGRALSVVEAGLGFVFLAVVVS